MGDVQDTKVDLLTTPIAGESAASPKRTITRIRLDTDVNPRVLPQQRVAGQCHAPLSTVRICFCRLSGAPDALGVIGYS